MKNEIIIGNSTTIINTIIISITGLIFATFGATLLKFGIDQKILTEIIGLIIGFIFAYINAKYHNTFFDKNNDEIRIPTNLNQDQINFIQDLIQEFTEKQEKNEDEITEIEQIDPTLEYETDEEGA